MEQLAPWPFPVTPKRLEAGCYASGLLGLALLALAWHAGPTGVRHYSCLAAGVFLGLSLGLSLVRLGRTELSRGEGFPWKEIGLIAGCGAVLALTAYRCGMRQFAGFDYSIVIDVAWRLINGQRPYVDFPCTLPVGIYLGAEAAFRLFGVYWRSIVLFNAIWTWISFLWLYGLLRGVFGNRLLAFWSALACAVMTCVADSFWWYNPMTAICGSVYAASVVAVILSPRSWLRRVSFCLSLFLLALMKPNVAGILILGGTIGLFTCRHARLPALVGSLFALCFWFLAIRIHGSTLREVLNAYLSVGSRGATFHQILDLNANGSMIWPERILTMILVCAMLVPALAKVASRLAGPGRPILIAGASCLLAGLYGFITNSDLAVVDFPLILLSGFFIVAGTAGRLEDRLRLVFSNAWTAWLTLICVVLTSVGLAQALIRNRVKVCKDFFEFTEIREPFTVPFFKGFHAGPNFHAEVGYLANLCAKEDMSHAFFGDDLQFAYAAFNLQSPKGQPVWWHPGASIGFAEQPFYIANWVSQKFNPVVCIGPIYMGDDFIEAIARDYGMRSQEDFGAKYPPPLQVLVRRDQGGASLQPWPPAK